jgi:hypothetical protein
LFNGKTQPHETCPFTGDRYTLVYYTSEINDNNNNNVMDRRYRRRATGTINGSHIGSSFDGNSDGVSPKLAMKFRQMKARLNKKFR